MQEKRTYVISLLVVDLPLLFERSFIAKFPDIFKILKNISSEKGSVEILRLQMQECIHP